MGWQNDYLIKVQNETDKEQLGHNDSRLIRQSLICHYIKQIGEVSHGNNIDNLIAEISREDKEERKNMNSISER